MDFFLFGKVVGTQKLSFFFFRPAPSPLSPSFFCYFLSPLLLFMAVILEFKQLVVWSKVCGFSGPIVMAASESEESHRAVG